MIQVTTRESIHESGVQHIHFGLVNFNIR